MAATGLLALLDDIATLLDDVAVLSKVAAKKTAGVLGDDLALNAEQVSGVRAKRELPVVWAVAKGSFVNKLILVPSALAISALLPWLITPLLLLGGLYLCFEGFEKVLHKLTHASHHDDEARKEKLKAVADVTVDLVSFEKEKIRGAIRTDFILSAEIIVITLGVVKAVSFSMQVAVVSLVAVLVTVCVYGLVAGIVKIDDAGYYLVKKDGVQRALGHSLLLIAPKLMKSLAIVGTVAMFLVGGGIVMHSVPFLHHLLHDIKHMIEQQASFLLVVTEPLVGGVAGVLAGAAVFAIVSVVKKFWPKQ